jgi:hypothetical protein
MQGDQALQRGLPDKVPLHASPKRRQPGRRPELLAGEELPHDRREHRDVCIVVPGDQRHGTPQSLEDLGV